MKRNWKNGKWTIPFKIGDKVYVWWPRAHTNIVEAIIINKISQLIFEVKFNNGHIMRAHVDSLKLNTSHETKEIDPPNINPFIRIHEKSQNRDR